MQYEVGQRVSFLWSKGDMVSGTIIAIDSRESVYPISVLIDKFFTPITFTALGYRLRSQTGKKEYKLLVEKTPKLDNALKL